MKSDSRKSIVTGTAAAALVMLALAFSQTATAQTQHYKMISSVEYSGRGQFKHRAESLFTVEKQELADDKVRFTISDNGKVISGDDISFIVDRANKNLTTDDSSLRLFESVHDRCVRSLKKVTSKNVGTTWKQSFNLAWLGNTMPREMNFTMTAIDLKTEALGDMIAVRALSEPFAFGIVDADGKFHTARCKVNSVYVFDSQIEDVYMSMTACEITGTVNGYREVLRHEVATYRTDASAIALDFTGLSKSFEKLVRKVGLRSRDLRVKKSTKLPVWITRDALHIVTLADTCAALACEGASNPVVTVCIPAGKMVTMQGLGHIASSPGIGTVAGSLAKGVGTLGGMKIAVAPGIMGMSPAAVGGVAGGSTAAGVAGGGGGGSSARSPSTP